MSNLPLSEDKFNLIFSLLIRDQEFRNKFFENPEAALKENNITLNDSELTSLKNNAFFRNEKVKQDFKEGLVLCSSSGY